jgi:uncharacterized protein
MKQLLKLASSFGQSLTRVILPLLVIIMSSFFVVTPAIATGVYDIPELAADTWVIDQGDVISRINEGKVSDELANLAKATGKEVRFLTIRRLDYGETTETFAKAIFTKWFPTEEAQANQTLLLLDVLTNNNAIITGNSVKGVMSDDIAKSVASETLMVPLRDGNKYNQGFIDATDRLVTVLSGKPDPGPPQIIEKVQVERTFKKPGETDQGNSTAWIIGLLIAATIIPMATYYIYLAIQPSSEG